MKKLLSLIVRKQIARFYPIFLTILLGTVLNFFISPLFNKWDFVFQDIDKMGLEFEQTIYADLNNNGIGEQILLGNDGVSGLAKYEIWEDGTKYHDQYNWPGKLAWTNALAFGDYDHNGLSELYLFTVKNDSVVLSIMEFGSERIIAEDLFIKELIYRKNVRDAWIQISPKEEGVFYDLNGDSKDEFVFTYQALYTGFPRLVFSLDVENLMLSQSKPTAALIQVNKIIRDKSNQPLMLAVCSAPGNSPPNDSTYLHDFSAWFITLDKDIQMSEPLMEIEGMRSSFSIMTLEHRDSTYLISRTRQFVGDSLFVMVNIHSSDLSIAASRKFSEHAFHGLGIYVVNDRIYLLDQAPKSKILEIGLNLETRQVFEYEGRIAGLQAIDIDEDGTSELLFYPADADETIILSSDFEIQGTIKGYAGNTRSLLNGRNEFAITTDDTNVIIARNANNKYYWKYPAFAGIYGLLFLLFSFQKRYRELKTKARREELLDYQLKALKNQIDPHFTFNVINSLSLVIAKGDLKTAQSYLDKFSVLMRHILDQSDEVLIPLADSLIVVEKYLELEQIRFKERLTFSIDVANAADLSVMIPRLMLHHFVDNAVRHGLRHKKEGGHVSIVVYAEKSNQIISIEDNGIGRKEAKRKNSESTGRGARIIENMLAVYGEQRKQKISYRIVDVYKDKLAAGTKVIIEIRNA